jgi:hypothetical protein
MTAPVTYNPFEYHRDPYPLYRRLRDEAPLCHNADLGCWTFSPYERLSSTPSDPQRRFAPAKDASSEISALEGTRL